MFLSSWSLTCWLVYNNFVGLVTKGYHGCKCCGPSLKAGWSDHLRNPGHDCSTVFLPKEHPYRRGTYAFNGKAERTQRPAIMTPFEWLRAYERDKEKEKEFAEMFDSNGETMFNDLEFFDTYVEKFPIGMKRKFFFYELPYWKHLKISHLLDPMHIFKNVSSSLWRHIKSK